MKKILLLLAVLGGWSGIMWGQDASSEIKKQINKIKKSQSYLSAEATMPSEEEALKTANELLVSEINDWVKTKRNSDKVQQIVLQDITTCTDKMNMKRGANFRAFVYVKKSDIVLIKGEGQIVLTDNEQGNDLQALSEISEPMKIEKEKPVSKEGKVEAAVVEKIEGNRAETSLKKILGAKTMEDMKSIFAGLKADDAIRYGAYPSDDISSGNYYLLFYARTGEIKAVVAVEEDKLSDVNTKQAVKLSDYSGYGAYWFELK